MNDMLTVGLGSAAIALILVVWLSDWFFRLSAIGLTIVAFSAGYVQLMVPVRVVALILVLGMIVYLIGSKRVSVSPKEKAQLIGLTVLCCSGFGIGQILTDVAESDPLFRYTLLYPAMLIGGFLAARAGKAIVLSRAYVFVSLGMAILASLEHLRGTFLVAGGYEYADRLVRDGTLRSVVFSEHPLVLSVLIAASAPFVPLTFKSRAARCLAYVILLSGVISTNSRGALAILAVWFVIRAATKINFVTPGTARVAKWLGFLSCTGAFIAIILSDGIDQLSSASAVDASAEYRGALYTFAIRSLIEQPWGWGISGLPEGVYLVPSYFGVLDISKTVDSELALSMFDFGWLGLCGFIGLLILQLRAGSLNNAFGQGALIVTASGFYLALHSWAGLGSMWLLLAGLALGGSASHRPKSAEDNSSQLTQVSGYHGQHLLNNATHETKEKRRILGPASQ